MTVYPTAYLEYHADQFVNARLDLHGLTLTQYLADPERYEHLLTQPFPLLPRQDAMRTRLYRQEIEAEAAQVAAEKQLEDLQCRNGALVEPLQHHRYPKKRGLACAFRRNRNKAQPSY